MGLAWTAFAGLCMGGGAAAIGRAGSSKATVITEADLQPFMPHAVSIINWALNLYRQVFCCGEPRVALKAAALAWIIAVASARFSILNLLWTSFLLSFAVPTTQFRFQHNLDMIWAKAVEELAKINALAEDKCPKKLSVPISTVVIFFCMSWTTVLMASGVGCIAFQAWRQANPNAQLNKKADSFVHNFNKHADAFVQNLNKTEVVHTLTKRARRMTFSAGEVLRYGVGKSL